MDLKGIHNLQFSGYWRLLLWGYSK